MEELLTWLFGLGNRRAVDNAAAASDARHRAEEMTDAVAARHAPAVGEREAA